MKQDINASTSNEIISARSQLLGDLLRRSASRYLKKVALVFREHHDTSSGLDKVVNRTANALAGLGIAKCDRVSILDRACPVTMFAAFRAEKVAMDRTRLKHYFQPHFGQYEISLTRRIVATLTIAAGLVVISSMPITASADTSPIDTYRDCHEYDRFVMRGSEVPVTSMCESLSPQMGGLRDSLADYGWGIQAFLMPSVTYDVLQNNDEGGQAYNGQEATYDSVSYLMMTYDLSRWGFNDNAQFTFKPMNRYNSYAGDGKQGINSTYIGQMSVYLPYMDDHVVVQAGYYKVSDVFYGSVIGTNAGASTQGPQSSLLAQLGAHTFKAVPAIDLRLWAPGKRFYSHTGVARSASPDGLFEEAERNTSGLRFSVPGARPLYIQELGYRRQASPGTKHVWVRAGAIYNTSDYDRLDGSGRTDNNTGYYAIADFQLTQDDVTPVLGWYTNLRYDEGDEALNAYHRDFSISLYRFGTFASRPNDVFSLGYSKQYVSDDFIETVHANGQNSAKDVTNYTMSYSYRVQRGLYLRTGLTWSDNPTLTPIRDEALNVNISLAFLL